MASPLITLTTDFGLSDHYVGAMKGVILSRCPAAHIVDISHLVTAFSLHSCAYTIAQAAPYFPPATVHVLVVDPGVGTARRPVLATALGQYFVAPDNGVLSLIAALDGDLQAREITDRRLWLHPVSETFHGRDIFAPVAAAVASGAAPPESVGPVLDRLVMLEGLTAHEAEPGAWNGTVLSIDHFGNIVTNFKSSDFANLPGLAFQILAGSETINRFSNTFGTAPPGLCFAYFGSSGYLELGIDQASAARHCALDPGAPITLLL